MSRLLWTEVFAHSRTQLLRVVADLKAQGKLDPASTQAHFLKRLDPCIAQNRRRSEHLLKQHMCKNSVKKPTATSVQDADTPRFVVMLSVSCQRTWKNVSRISGGFPELTNSPHLHGLQFSLSLKQNSSTSTIKPNT